MNKTQLPELISDFKNIKTKKRANSAKKSDEKDVLDFTVQKLVNN